MLKQVGLKAKLNLCGKSSKELDYIQDSLYALGCKGVFLFEKLPNGKIEYILAGLV